MSPVDTSEDENLHESDNEDRKLDNVVHQLNWLTVAEDLERKLYTKP